MKIVLDAPDATDAPSPVRVPRGRYAGHHCHHRTTTATTVSSLLREDIQGIQGIQ